MVNVVVLFLNLVPYGIDAFGAAFYFIFNAGSVEFIA